MTRVPGGFQKSGMRNLKLILSYDGSEFSGWQVQPETPTVQGTLATAIGRVTGEKVLPQGSGRTDRGVHAQAQAATLDRKSTRLNYSHVAISYAVFCLKKKIKENVSR